MNPGDRLTVTIDKPAAGGRMIARHEGRVLFVSGAIPGEVVEVLVERVQRGTVWASVARLIEPSGDRVDLPSDGSCGGNVYAHVRYERQLELKRDIVRDGFARLARLTLDIPFDVAASPVNGYRMRARLHVRDGHIGFFREGTHDLCSIRATRQLSDHACDVIERLEQALASVPHAQVSEIELSENMSGSERACHLDLHRGSDPSRLGSATTIPGLCGVSCAAGADARALVLWGEPRVSDAIETASPSGATIQARLSRHARSFFQGNRFLLTPLIDHVCDLVPDGPVVDLYAGVGLFSVTRAARGGVDVTAVEGDRWASDDLRQNAVPFQDTVVVRRQTVERLPSTLPRASATTVIVDPPRTGMSRDATRLVIGWRPARLVYVSCDIATLARDARLLFDAGYVMTRISAFDLFPNTAHVETVAVFDPAG